MSLFGSLYIGTSGLQTSQNALNTVAHNLSNVSTSGYVRQQVAKSDKQYTTIGTSTAGDALQTGSGVTYAECRHIRDAFLDATYREEVGRYEYYEASYTAMLEVEDILGELDGAAFKGSMEDLWTAIEQLSTSPNDVTYISLLVQAASSFIENATAVYESFTEYQENLNDQVISAVDNINSIAEQIVALNKQIVKIEASGVENANDLRDQRDLLLDELAEYGNISYQEDSTGAVIVQFENNSFINATNYYEMSMMTDEDTGFVTPYWKQNVVYTKDENGIKYADYSSAYVYDLTAEISSASDTDVGSLRALLLARGDHAADYTDLDVSICSQRKLDALGITEDEYNEEYGLQYYNDYISNSIMMNVMAEFDNIVHTVVTTINDVLAETAQENPVSGYLLNDDGSPMQLFVKANSSAYEKVVLTSAEEEALLAQGVTLVQIYDEDGNAVDHTFWKYVEEDADSAFSLYSCSNLKINQTLLQTPSLLGFTEEDDSVDYDIGTALVNAFSDKTIYINPNATAESAVFDAYTDLVSQVANSGYVFGQLMDYQELAVESADNSRQSVMGVSSDEELSHMIMYQNAYNAASRYITVINDMLDTLLSMGA